MPEWPDLPGFDYSEGFPLTFAAAVALKEMPEGDDRDELVRNLQAAAFEALTRCDIERL